MFLVFDFGFDHSMGWFLVPYAHYVGPYDGAVLFQTKCVTHRASSSELLAIVVVGLN